MILRINRRSRCIAASRRFVNWHLSAKAALRRHGGITDKDGCRKPATLLIPLKEEEAELWKNHELDDDALMKIALSFEVSIE